MAQMNPPPPSGGPMGGPPMGGGPMGYPPGGQPMGYPPMGQPEMKPHRGVMILILGIAGVLCCGFAGLAAFFLGRQDIGEMDAGLKDPAGRGMTQAGQYIGLIGFVLQVVGGVLARFMDFGGSNF